MNTLRQDALQSRQEAAETILGGTVEAAMLLVDQVRNFKLEPKERRAAAIALLNYAGLGEVTARGAQDGPRQAGVNHLLDILNERPPPVEILENPFA